MKEKWINEINGLENIKGYKICSNGDVISYIKRHNHNYIVATEPRRKLKPFKNKKGYLCVDLNSKSFRIHRLVALAFIPNPENKPQVNHIDGNKCNNNVSNLEWCTNSENQLHAFKHNLQKPHKGKECWLYDKKYGNHPCSKKIGKFDLDDNLIQIYTSIKQASEEHNIHYTNIVKCCTGVIKTSCGYKWKYIE